MLFGYPNNSTEVRNMDYVLTRLQEIENLVNLNLDTHIANMIHEKFNSLFVNSAYDGANKRLILTLESISIAGAEHTYNSNNESMTIK